MQSASQTARMLSHFHASSSGRCSAEALWQPSRRSATGPRHPLRSSSRQHRSPPPLQVVTDDGSKAQRPGILETSILETSDGMEGAEEPPRSQQEAQARSDSKSKLRGRPTQDWRRWAEPQDGASNTPGQCVSVMFVRQACCRT